MELLQPDKDYSWNSHVHTNGFYHVPYTVNPSTPYLRYTVILSHLCKK